jgi:hypothetical protein
MVSGLRAGHVVIFSSLHRAIERSSALNHSAVCADFDTGRDPERLHVWDVESHAISRLSPLLQQAFRER